MAHSTAGGRPKMVPKMVTGLFSDRQSAERAYQAVIERGYDNSQIDLVMSDETRDRYFSNVRQIDTDMADTDLANRAEAGTGQGTKTSAGLGGPVGGTMGTIAPALAAVGALMLIPGLVIAGPVAIALAAAGTVGVAGGIVGALADWGVPKERIDEYAAGIRNGGILIGVKPRDDADASYIEKHWKADGGALVHS